MILDDLAKTIEGSELEISFTQDAAILFRTRQIIEKASFHGFKNSPVQDYMSSEFAAAHPRTTLSKVQDLIVGNNQRFLPVLERDKLVGAITRTDLLRWLYISANRPPPLFLNRISP